MVTDNQPGFEQRESPSQARSPLEQALADALELLARKEQELAEARHSEERYRSLVEKVMDLVFCVDRHGIFTFVNSAVLSLLGYRQEELVGQHFESILAGESREVAISHFSRNLKGRGPRLVYELEMLSKGGVTIPMEVHGTNVYENGEIVGIRGIARDISERRRHEERQHHHLTEMRTINQVGQQIAAVLSLDELLPFIANLVRDSFDYSNVNVFLRDKAGKNMVLRASATNYPWPVPLGTSLKIGREGIVGWVASAGEPVVANDVSKDPRYLGIRELQLTRSELAVPVQLGNRIVGVLDVGSDHPDAFDEGDLWVAQTLADQIAVALRNADLFQAERTRRQETTLILEITRGVNSTLLLDEVLQVAISGIARAVGVQDCGLYLLDETGTKLLPKRVPDGPMVRMLGDAYMATTLDIPSSPFLSEVMKSRHPVLCANAETDPRINRKIVESFHLKSLLAVPFFSRDRVLGAAMVSSYQDFYDFRPEQVELAAGIANSVALAIENARLYERTRELAVMEERNRLAREIHDTIAQGLTGIILQLEAAEQLMDSNLDKAQTRVHKATALARSSLQEARRSVWNLRPTPLEERTLIEAIRQESNRLAEETSIQVDFHAEGELGGLSGEMENALFRIAQEAINNVRKHARASHVEVNLRLREGVVEVEIRDDGVGFDPAALKPGDGEGGFGLLGLLERARLLGGSLHIESSPGHGTLVAVRVPVKQEG